MSPRTFKVSPGRALVGNVLGPDLSKYSSDELEAMVQDLEDFYAEEAEASRDEEAPNIQSPKE